MNPNCLFCKIISKEEYSYSVYENEFVYAFLDAFPNSDGHTLIVPKVHFQDLSSTDDLYLAEVAKAKKIVAKLLENKLPEIRGFNFATNEKAIAGQVIFHYHEHVIPKYKEGEGYFHNKNVKLKYDLETLHKKIK